MECDDVEVARIREVMIAWEKVDREREEQRLLTSTLDRIEVILLVLQQITQQELVWFY